MKNIYTYLLIIGLAFSTTACGMNDVNFKDRKDLRYSSDYDPLQERRYNGYQSFKTPKTYGALNFKDNADPDDEGDNIIIKRLKSRFYAERTVFKAVDATNAFIDETLLNFGVEKDFDAISAEVRFKF